MNRPDGDVYYCFECSYFSGREICYKHLKPMPRKGWDASCDHFALAALGEGEEEARKAKSTWRKAVSFGLV